MNVSKECLDMFQRNSIDFFRRFITVMKHGWSTIIRDETTVKTMSRSRKYSKKDENSSINRKSDDCFLGFSCCVHWLFRKKKNYQENIMQHYWIKWMMLLRPNVLIRQRKSAFLSWQCICSHFFIFLQSQNYINYA